MDITSTGTMSIDGGATTTPISVAANQVVTDSQNGAIVKIDSSAINRNGTDQLEFPGTTDVFNAICGLRDDLLNTRNLSLGDRATAISRRVGDLERVHAHVLDIIGVSATRLKELTHLQQFTMAAVGQFLTPYTLTFCDSQPKGLS